MINHPNDRKELISYPTSKVLTEKYFLHNLQRYKIEDFRLVFLMTKRVDKQTGHLYFFIYPIYEDFAILNQLEVPFAGNKFVTVPSADREDEKVRLPRHLYRSAFGLVKSRFEQAENLERFSA